MSSRSIANPLPSGSTRIDPSLNFGILAARSGFQWPSAVTVNRPRIVAARTYELASDVEITGLSWLAACQSEITMLPPGVPASGL